ncbi:MAG: tRNA pseudouridine(38-40) synthase [Acidimicrobiales bacterium]|nr:tRNA pseudouridine(38-40) synthase [Acidimicrobiales bacterium]
MTLFDAKELATGPRGPTSRVRLTVAYDGQPFHGFAINDGVRTVAGVLTHALTTYLGHPVELTCAGRTDRGVHARAQVVSFDAAAEGLDLGALQRAVSKMCGPSVVVTEAVVARADFDARFDATARRYRYLVLNRPVADPFLAPLTWHVEKPLDLPAMVLACDPLIGEHDFSAFCRRPKRRDGAEASLVRRVTAAEWHDDGAGLLRFEIEASSFCHQMVRSVVGTLVGIGLGRRRAGELTGIIRSRDRAAAGDLAPPHGLMLWLVRYGDWSSAPEA